MSPLPVFQPGEILEAAQLNDITAAIDDLNSRPEWQSAVWNSGFSGQYAQYRVVGDEVQVRWYCTTAISSGSTASVLNLPEPARPPDRVPAIVYAPNVGNGQIAHVQASGSIIFVAATSMTSHFGQARYWL